MTGQPRQSPAGADKRTAPRSGGQKPGHGSHARHGHAERRSAPTRSEPVLSKYGELLQDIQDEASYFLPVDALSAGTQRYLYHLGDYSDTSSSQMQQFLRDMQEEVTRLQQGKLNNAEQRSSVIVSSYMSSLAALLEGHFFSDTLWQLHNARKGLYQALYLTELPMYVRGKALVHRLEELSLPPTAPVERVQLRSASHRELALKECEIIDHYLDYVGEKASGFEDKQAIAEYCIKAQQYMDGVKSKVLRSTTTGDSTRDALVDMLVPELDDTMLNEAQDSIAHEVDALRRQLHDLALRIDAVRDPTETIAAVLDASLARPLDQQAIDTWLANDFARLHSFFPGFRLASVPVPGNTLSVFQPYDDSEVVALKGTATHRRQVVCPVLPSRRWLSNEINLMMTYFPGKAYIQAAMSAWDPCLPFHAQRDMFIAALAFFELQNIAGVDGALQAETSLLATLQIMVEDVSAALDIEIIQHRLTHDDTTTFLRAQLALPPETLAGVASIATYDYGHSLVRFLYRSRFRELRRLSRLSNKKMSWTAFYQNIFEQGTFDPAQLKNP